MAETDAPLSRILDELSHAGGDGKVTVGGMLDAFEHRSLGVLLTVFGLLAALPVIGGIPGMSIFTASMILIAIVQYHLGGRSLWAPGFIRRRAIGRKTFDAAVKKSRPAVRWVDGLLKPRMLVLVAGRTERLAITVSAAVLAVTFYPLAFIPWGVTPPSLGVLALGLGMVGCDGMLVLFGYAMAALTAYLMVVLFL